jgi:hypothetical protein
MTRAEVTRIDEVSLSQMRTRLERWGSHLNTLETNALALGGETASEIQQRIKDLRAKYQIARGWFDAFNVAGTARWGLFRFCIQSAWSDFQTALEELKKQVAIEDTPKSDDP